MGIKKVYIIKLFAAQAGNSSDYGPPGPSKCIKENQQYNKIILKTTLAT